MVIITVWYIHNYRTWRSQNFIINHFKFYPDPKVGSEHLDISNSIAAGRNTPHPFQEFRDKFEPDQDKNLTSPGNLTPPLSDQDKNLTPPGDLTPLMTGQTT